MNLYSSYERYWCPALLSGSFAFLAWIVLAPLWH